jgi:hypothetical protein
MTCSAPHLTARHGTGHPLGAALLDQEATYPVTLRVSKAIGTRGTAPTSAGWPSACTCRAADRPFAELTVGRPPSPGADAALAFDPVRNALPDLHPTGLIHAARAFAYRWSQRWRGAAPAHPNPDAVKSTAADP